MDIYWYGQSCFKLKGKTASVIIDPFDPEFTGLKLPSLEADVVLKTHNHEDHNNTSIVTGNPLVFDGPGEYESKGVVITGVSAYHDNSEGQERGRNTIYNVTIDRLNIVHLGDLGQSRLSESQVQEIDVNDILLIPVGSIFTIDGKVATEIVAQLEPKIIIPMHYGGVPGLKFPLEPVEKFLKEMGAENTTPIAKLSISKDKLPEEPMVVVLSKS